MADVKNKVIERFKSDVMEDNEIIIHDKCHPLAEEKDLLEKFVITAKPNELDPYWVDISEVWITKTGSAANYAYTISITKESIKKLYEEFGKKS